MLGGDEVANFFDGLLMEVRIADDSSARDVIAAQLELRLDQADD